MPSMSGCWPSAPLAPLAPVAPLVPATVVVERGLVVVAATAGERRAGDREEARANLVARRFSRPQGYRRYGLLLSRRVTDRSASSPSTRNPISISDGIRRSKASVGPHQKRSTTNPARTP